ncbi:ROK family protein [Melghirimyces profundicolus]|uniref:ROK family protein n=1 Tax=Melghirimyces profundicolus TaxID=1242148 RepID=A0A2T6BQY6_9BACL|nr:ROK family protein [Melghirimyces profundicolus]PTX58488.1 ROK family protein [Melghirimyces profundicolus]
MNSYTIGLDIGGTKIAAGLIDKQGRCLHDVTLPSLPDDSEAMFKQVKASVDRLVEKGNAPTHSIRGLGIGVPGKVDRERGIAVMQANLPWRNFPLISRLKEYYPWPILLDHDVAAAAYGEWVHSRGVRRRHSFT